MLRTPEMVEVMEHNVFSAVPVMLIVCLFEHDAHLWSGTLWLTSDLKQETYRSRAALAHLYSFCCRHTHAAVL